MVHHHFINHCLNIGIASFSFFDIVVSALPRYRFEIRLMILLSLVLWLSQGCPPFSSRTYSFFHVWSLRLVLQGNFPSTFLIAYAPRSTVAISDLFVIINKSISYYFYQTVLQYVPSLGILIQVLLNLLQQLLGIGTYAPLSYFSFCLWHLGHGVLLFHVARSLLFCFPSAQ